MHFFGVPILHGPSGLKHGTWGFGGATMAPSVEHRCGEQINLQIGSFQVVFCHQYINVSVCQHWGTIGNQNISACSLFQHTVASN